MTTKTPWDLLLELDAGSELVAAPQALRATAGPALRDRFVATMVGGAVGDALGRPVERWPRPDVAATYPDGLRDYLPWRGWVSGPVGTITDDTQLSIAVAEWLRDAGAAELPEGDDIGRRYAEWLPVARGAGPGSLGAAQRLAAGAHWSESARKSSGNGVAMRSAAIGLRYQGDLERIRQATALSGLPTHRDSAAVGGGVVIAAMVSHLLTRDDRTFDPAEVIAAGLAPLDGIAFETHAVGGYEDRRATLRELIASTPEALDWEPDRAFDHFYNGSFVIQSLPMMLWLFCRFGAGDPERLLVECVAGGRDADSIAAMAGNLAGALHGLDAFPARWTGDHLEYRELLGQLAGDLYDLWATEPTRD
jgi:ADP-ribosylglycohydrolase